MSIACSGLIPADGDVWKARRRAIVPSLHRKYIENMVGMFADSALHGVSSLQQAHQVSGRALLGVRSQQHRAPLSDQRRLPRRIKTKTPVMCIIILSPGCVLNEFNSISMMKVRSSREAQLEL